MNAHRPVTHTPIGSVEDFARAIARDLRAKRNRAPSGRYEYEWLPDPSPDFGWQAVEETLDPYLSQPFGLSRSV